MRILSRLAIAVSASACLAAAAANAEAPAIARPGLPRIGVSAADANGVVFFLESELAHGMVAVGTAHTFELEALARAQRVELASPGALALVATSERFAVPPGKAFSAADGTLRGDFVVLLLASAPRGVRALPAEAKPVSMGARVRLLGPASRGQRDEQDAFGTVVAATAERIEIDLDVATSLVGWGGAPVLASDTDRVVGIVEAAVPGAQVPRVLAAPIGGVLDALRDPLEAGKGQVFAEFTAAASATASKGSETPATERSRLLQPTAGKGTNLELAIEYPSDGAQVSSTVCGTFVAGRAQATRGTPRRFDVMIVIDTSASSGDASGTDVNGNGTVGAPKLGGFGTIFGAGLTDDGDSILAAEVAAARRVLAGLDPRSTRVGLAAFAGDPLGTKPQRKPAFTIEGLTRDYSRIELGLDELAATTPVGNTHMAAGVDQATIELAGLRGAYSKPDPEAERVVFFFTDGQPTLPYAVDAEAQNVRAVLHAANRANRAGIRIHSFAIGPEALEGPIAAVEMASRTRGYFTPVRNPGDLADIVEEVSFADIEKVTLQHAKTHVEANPFRLTADGSWAGFIALEPGPNTVRAVAVAEEGATAERRIQLSLVDGPNQDADLPVDLVVQRNRLLEDCLLIAKQQRLAREQERNEEIRKALLLEIDRERRKARERADQQRKQLELEGEAGEDVETE